MVSSSPRGLSVARIAGLPDYDAATVRRWIGRLRRGRGSTASPLRDAPVRVPVNNAGIALLGMIEDFIRRQRINATAPYLIVQVRLPRLAAPGAGPVTPV
ncbi:hypothetical protein GCM10022252_24140 [Streptosporangium oxazolinicum]|uniref:Transposase n=2 Tax=Streptosporangium oxazolinicum TaxID=909287 RepID=A0ABP8AR88_9ACTN